MADNDVYRDWHEPVDLGDPAPLIGGSASVLSYCGYDREGDRQRVQIMDHSDILTISRPQAEALHKWLGEWIEWRRRLDG